MSLAYRPPKTLRRFMRSNAFVRAVVGPVGSGKSSACVMEIVRRAREQAPGEDGMRRTRWCVIRNTFPQLRDTTKKTFEQWIPAALGEWHKQEFAFTIDQPLKDGTRIHCEVLFRALDRPDDVGKLLSLELTGAYLNEARELPKAVFDVLQTRVGRYPSKRDGGPTWFGIWLDTNPWHVGHWGFKLFSEDHPPGFELFEQPGGRAPDAENVENLPPGYYQRLTAGKNSAWVDEYVDGKYPSADQGSVYGPLMAALKARGGVADFQHPLDGVFTNWDLGISDSTAIWFWRLSAQGVDVVDHYEAHGQPLSHFFNVIRSRPYRYVKHILPHDARARTLVTGRSTQDEFVREFGGEFVSIGPQLSLQDGIGAARLLLEHPGTRIHARCAEVNGPSDIDGIDALREYRFEYDEANKVYSRKPLHNWASHTADAFRYVGCMVSVAELLTRTTAAAGKIKAPPTEPTVTLSELFELADNDNAARTERV